MADNQNIGFVWLYCLVVIFVLGIIQLLILPALEAKLIPPMIATMDTTTPGDVAAFTGQVAQVITFMDYTMYVIMFVVFVYGVISIFKREETYYQ